MKDSVVTFKVTALYFALSSRGAESEPLGRLALVGASARTCRRVCQKAEKGFCPGRVGSDYEASPIC